MQQAKEASGVFERLGYPVQQVRCLVTLAWLLLRKERFDLAGEMAFHAIDVLPEKDERIPVYECHRVLGQIYKSKGKTEKAVYHSEIVLGVASTLNDAGFSFPVHFDLVVTFAQQGRFGDAQTRVEHARSFAVNDTYLLTRASLPQAELWYM